MKIPIKPIDTRREGLFKVYRLLISLAIDKSAPLTLPLMEDEASEADNQPINEMGAFEFYHLSTGD